jgi:hypothetical protein
MFTFEKAVEILGVEEDVVVDFHEILGIVEMPHEVFHRKSRLDCEIRVGINEILDDNVVKHFGFVFQQAHGRFIA